LIRVQGDLGDRAHQTQAIRGQSIDVITVSGDIFLGSINATKGSVAGVSASYLRANVTAVGGDVRNVSVGWLAGNVRALALLLGPGPVGGNIWRVSASSGMDKVTIAAAFDLGVVEDGTGGLNQAAIEAQSGASFDPFTGVATPLALRIIVPKGQFQGTVKFGFRSASAPFARSFNPGDGLLQVKDTNGNKKLVRDGSGNRQVAERALRVVREIFGRGQTRREVHAAGLVDHFPLTKQAAS
jgi:hypothetical protein